LFRFPWATRASTFNSCSVSGVKASVSALRVLSRMLIFDPRNAGLWLQRAQLRLEDADFAGAQEDVESARQLPLEGDWLRVADDVARRIDVLGKTPQ